MTLASMQYACMLLSADQEAVCTTLGYLCSYPELTVCDMSPDIRGADILWQPL